MNKLIDNVLEKIQEEQIEPKSKWAFLLKDGVVWSVGIASLLLGSLALAVIFSVLFNADFELGRQLGKPGVRMFFLVLPYLWVVLLGVFILLAHYQVRHTKRGYKFSLPVIILSVIGGSLVLGAGLYQLGVGQAVDEHFVQRSELYRGVIQGRLDFVHNPEEGRLSGRVVESGNDSLELKDLTGHVLEVDVSEANLPFERQVPEGAMVRITGEAQSERFFIADELQPLKPKDKLRDHFRPLPEMKEDLRSMRTRE